ncbi:MAG: 16S rRNA (cytidine(1402)-2'-O)-methyltransferase [Betaproteobacteria bacterium]
MLSAAAQAAGAQDFPPGALYVVATPIGNLADITLRAVHTLALVDAVACEDTRQSAHLLAALGLHKPLLAVHEHNEREGAQRVVERLQRGERVAYISDAGTPAVSDPGAALVQAVREAGCRCLPLPGASSALAALSVAGDVSKRGFRFVGFLPSKGSERAAALRAAVMDACSVVLFESPHRVEALAAELALACPARLLTVARELTKQFEAVHTQAAGEWPAWLAADPNRRRGEFVLVLHGTVTGPSAAPQATGPGSPGHAQASTPEEQAAHRVLAILLRDLPVKQAATLGAEISGLPKKRLYQWALDLKDAQGEGVADA